jgi:hypothetical protein
VKGAAVELSKSSGLFAEINSFNDRVQALEEWAMHTHERLLGPVAWDAQPSAPDTVNGDIDRAINRLKQADRALTGLERHFKNIVGAL